MFFYLFAAFGLSFILMYGKPLNKPRDYLRKKLPFLKNLLICYFCTGFWSGIIIDSILYKQFSPAELILFPLASCGFCGFFGLTSLLIEQSIKK